ncbi:PKD domain-containing protein [Frankia sp. Cppng1_Ct_nod]|uniref:PKD domain-containing protein n=1 Tax=Frankia sp. Cppng1_Ct_nod TaxID=2897162 RepID=UPI001F5F2BB5|nr:PKD domain-containing protein [Frankia sp. Cppng1_Ct_nod]
MTGYRCPRVRRNPRVRRTNILRLLAVGLFVVTVSLPTATSVDAAPDAQRTNLICSTPWGSCDTRATDNGYIYTFSDGRLKRTPATGAGTTARAGVTDPCPDCSVPVDFCNLKPQEALANFQNALWAAFPDAAIATNAGCDPAAAPGAPPTLPQVQAALVNYLREQALPRPTLVIQPNGRSFANLLTVLYTPVPPAFTFNVDQPVLATISAVPHYRWDFGDGTFGQDAPGRPYDPAISPKDHPDAYVAHAYARPGTYTVTLTVTWAGTFAVPGVAQAFPLAPVVLAVNAAIVVDEATGVLTGNG